MSEVSTSGGGDSGYVVLRMVGDGVEREINAWEEPRVAKGRLGPSNAWSWVRGR